MKKLTILLIILLSIASAKILVHGNDLADIDEHYIKMNVSVSSGPKYYAYVDYGQDAPAHYRYVQNEKGQKRCFDSEVDILNVFYVNGWEIKTAITEPSGGADGCSVSGDTYYILERIDDK